MKNKFLTRLVFALATGISCNQTALAQKQPKPGQELFESKCAACHGKDGTKGRLGAINLQASRISDAEMLQTISKGRRIMPRWEKKLTEEQLKSVAQYVKNLRK